MTSQFLSKDALERCALAGSTIAWYERDLYLKLERPSWAQDFVTGEEQRASQPKRRSKHDPWVLDITGVPRRTLWPITRDVSKQLLNATADAKGEIPVPAGLETLVRERILRFPSAPAFRFNAAYAHVDPTHSRDTQIDPGGQPMPRTISAYHTMRLIDLEEQDDKPVDRVFVFINGLNETKGLELFYQLAGWLLRETAATGQRGLCIIRPFPGHLTRNGAVSDLVESPLNRYLDDSLELFRHYAKFVVESQWLLSVLVPRYEYDSVSGSRLTATRNLDNKSRGDAGYLAKRILKDWVAIQGASPDHERGVDKPARPLDDHIKGCIDTLREIVHHEPLTGLPQPGKAERPEIHVIGYSLGGFVAQSVFNLWPYVIASCTTLCSGGALRDLTLTSFANPEEWRTLLHSLRYRLDAELHGDTFKAKDHLILGIRERFAVDLLRTFYEVFEQNDASSYQSRMSEYFNRFLFVVGGNDPIVKPRTVLDAMPSEGANVIEIAGMTHFISTEQASANAEETEQRNFWFPEVAKFMSRWAPQTERLRARSVAAGWRVLTGSDGVEYNAEDVIGGAALSAWEFAYTDEQLYPQDATKKRPKQRRRAQSSVNVRAERDLAVGAFEDTLDFLAQQTETLHDGYLLISQNHIPTWMFNADYWVHRAKSFNHSEENIRAYLMSLRARRGALIRAGKGVVVLAPDRELSRMVSAETPTLNIWAASPSSEVIQGETLDLQRSSDDQITRRIHESFRRVWVEEQSVSLPAVRRFSPGGLQVNSPSPPDLEMDDEQLNSFVKAAQLIDDSVKYCHLTRLPECWVRVTPGESDEHHYDAVSWAGDVDLRPTFLHWFITTLANNADLITEKLDLGLLNVVSRSQAVNNPRFRGRTITDAGQVQKVLRGLAACLLLSNPL